MYSVTSKRVIDAPLDKVWNVLADFGGINRFHPAVEKVDIISAKKEGEGTVRVCTMYGGQKIEEQLVKQVDGEFVDVAIVGGDMPIKQGKGTLAVRAVSANQTEVSITIQFQPKFGALGDLMAPMLFKPMFKRLLSQLLVGLDKHLETGAEIGKGGVLLAA